MRNVLWKAALLALLTSPVWANDYQKGADAYLKGDFGKARDLLLPLSEDGNADAQLLIGDMFRWGEGFERNKTRALNWYRKAAKLGHKSAQETLGIHYDETGNRTRAFDWLSEAAKQNSAEAKYRLSRYYMYGRVVGRDQETAKTLLFSAATLGNAKAQTVVGAATVLYSKFDNDTLYSAGIDWLNKAIEQDYAPASYFLGLVYLKGQGVQTDPVLAAQHFQTAAEKGERRAQLELGKLFEAGNGVAANDEEAFYWYRLAERNKVRGASEARKRIYQRMDRDVYNAARQRADSVKLKKRRFEIDIDLLQVVEWGY